MKTLFNNRGIRMIYDSANGTYIVKTQSDQTEYTCPLRAWNDYVTKLDIFVRRQIGEMLILKDKNPYTGQLNSRISKERETE